MDLVEEYYRTGRLSSGCAMTCGTSRLCGTCGETPSPPENPPPPMTPPPSEDVLFVYDLRQPIDNITATLVWSFFSESYGIFLPEKGPYTKLLCTQLINIPEVHKKMAEFSKHYDLRCFDTVYILPGCVMQAHI